MRKITITLIFLLLFLSGFYAYCQSGINKFLKPADSLITWRRNTVLITEGALFVGGVAQIEHVTQEGYFNSNFHLIDDNASYLEMDKSAHVFSSYQFSNFATEGLKWSGMSRKNSLIFGAGAGYLFLQTIELMDGFNGKGTSLGDLIANTVGSSLYVTQELLWKEQRIVPKFSSGQINFISSNPAAMKSQIVLEYNEETYWLSCNLHSFAPKSKIPRWFNVALGHGVQGVGSSKEADVAPVGAYHQFYLSLDVDFTKIRTKSHVLKTIFFVFNYLKVPSPTLEYNNVQGLKFHGIYF